MVLFALHVINKAGGLIYNTDFPVPNGLAVDPPPRLTSNEYLVLAGTFHGVHAITSKISPTADASSSGLESMESDTFKLQCLQTPTGIKFIVLADPQHANLDNALQRIYEHYADYVMKNPFYTPEMPIRCELFDANLIKLVKTL